MARFSRAVIKFMRSREMGIIMRTISSVLRVDCKAGRSKIPRSTFDQSLALRP
jgi:hypothetical protein